MYKKACAKISTCPALQGEAFPKISETEGVSATLLQEGNWWERNRYLQLNCVMVSVDKKGLLNDLGISLWNIPYSTPYLIRATQHFGRNLLPRLIHLTFSS